MVAISIIGVVLFGADGFPNRMPQYAMASKDAGIDGGST